MDNATVISHHSNAPLFVLGILAVIGAATWVSRHRNNKPLTDEEMNALIESRKEWKGRVNTLIDNGIPADKAAMSVPHPFNSKSNHKRTP